MPLAETVRELVEGHPWYPNGPPPGYQIVARVDPDWRIALDLRCRYTVGPTRKACGDPSVAALLRGKIRPSWWGYCAQHLYGRWIEDGRVLAPALEPTP